MASAGRILWIDNDRAYLRPNQRALEFDGYKVTIVETVSGAENFLTDGNYDLVILDVMMPITEKDEAEGYSPVLTDHGHKTGLAFYVRNRDLLLARSLPVMVMTVIIDQDIVDEFVAAGVPRRFIVSKFEVNGIEAFLEKVRSTMAAGTDQA